MKTLFEQYRPATFEQVIGQEKAIGQLQTIGRRGFGGNAIWFAGQSGTGKTTLAKIVASEVASEFCTDELDAGELTPARVKEIELASQTYGMGDRNGKAYIVNESHGLRKDTIRQLLVTLERIPGHVCWIFTTTIDGQLTLLDGIDSSPLLSRCLPITLARRGLAEPFAARCREIAIAEGLASESTPLKSFVELAKQSRNNFREMLQAIAAGNLAT